MFPVGSRGGVATDEINEPLGANMLGCRWY